MGLPTITRGIGTRNDGLVQILDFIQSGSVSGTSSTTDGDIVSFLGTFTSPSVGDTAIGWVPVASGPAFATYPKWMVRFKSSIPANYVLELYVHYSVGVTEYQVLSAASQANLTVVNGTLNGAGGVIDRLGFQVRALLSAATGSFNVAWDFILIFKELLTLPTASKTVRQRVKRRIVPIPIPFREGDVTQDLGSDSPEYDIAGQLVTTGPYTADQWWGIGQGLLLETGNAQADGNPSWQWFTWDQGSAKVLVVSFVMDENPGRIANWDYQVQLKQFDLLGRTFANPVGGVLATY